MHILISILIKSLAVFIAQYLLPGVSVDDFVTAVFVAIALGLVNLIVKPIISLIALPITIITLGLFSFVINACMILLVSTLVSGFHVDGFVPALLFSLVLSIVSSVLSYLFTD